MFFASLIGRMSRIGLIDKPADWRNGSSIQGDGRENERLASGLIGQWRPLLEIATFNEMIAL